MKFRPLPSSISRLPCKKTIFYFLILSGGAAHSHECRSPHHSKSLITSPYNTNILLPWYGTQQKKMFTLLDLCVSSLRRGHANLLCIVPILSDDPRRESNRCSKAKTRHETEISIAKWSLANKNTWMHSMLKFHCVKRNQRYQ